MFRNVKQPDKRRRTWGDRAILAILAVVIPLVTVAGLIMRSQDDMPYWNIPGPIPPYPDAFNYYFSAIQASVPGAMSRRWDRVDLLSPQELAAATSEVKSNAHALSLLRQGLAYRYLGPILPKLTGTPTFLDGFQNLAREMALKSSWQAAHGDWAGSMNTCLDAIEFGESTASGARIPNVIAGVTCQDIGRRQAWDDVDHLSAAQCKSAIRKLQTTLDRRISWPNVVQVEEWTDLIDVRVELMELDKPGWQLQFEKDHRLTQTDRGAGILFLTKRQVLEDMRAALEADLTAANAPYGTMPRPIAVTDPFTSAIIPSAIEPRERDTACVAGNRMLLVSLALRGYRVEHGKYPRSLYGLVPAYLSTVPQDPFTANAILRYRQTGNTYLLYSVGPDMKDDGGQPINDPTKPDSHGVDIDSKGDMVAGVNR